MDCINAWKGHLKYKGENDDETGYDCYSGFGKHREYRNCQTNP